MSSRKSWSKKKEMFEIAYFKLCLPFRSSFRLLTILTFSYDSFLFNLAENWIVDSFVCWSKVHFVHTYESAIRPIWLSRGCASDDRLLMFLWNGIPRRALFFQPFKNKITVRKENKWVCGVSEERREEELWWHLAIHQMMVVEDLGKDNPSLSL